MSAITTTTTEQACCPSCAEPGRTAALANACTLDHAHLDGRLAAIRDLAMRSLREQKRDGLKLHLTYDERALAEVEALVAQEMACCTFLNFDLAHGRGVVHLTITAPASFADEANDLFAHFAPGEPGAAR